MTSEQRAARKALLSLARWHRQEMATCERLRIVATKEVELETAYFYRVREIMHRASAREAERRARGMAEATCDK